MKRKLLALAVFFVLTRLIPGSAALQNGQTDLLAANDAWTEGRYSVALRSYIQLLNSNASDQYLDPIALQTGELFQTEEITNDGRSPQFSRNGQLIAYETGSGTSSVIRVVQTDENRRVIAELPGTGAVFSPSGTAIAYLKLKQSDELAKAQEEFDRASEGAQRRAAQTTLNWLQAKYSLVMLHDLNTNSDVELETGALLKSSLAFGVDDQTVYFAGGVEGATARNDIYAVSRSSGQPVVMSDCEGFKTSPTVDAAGKTLLFSMPNRNPFATPQRLRADGSREQEPADSQPDRAGQPDAQRQRQGQGGFGTPTKFGIVDLQRHKTAVVNGMSPSLARDGRSVAYVTRSEQENTLSLINVGAEPESLLKTPSRLDAPVFSPDGERIVYQKMVRDDWDLYLIGKNGKNDARLTHEIQHDALPQFISADRMIAVIGEARHRRSFLYDLAALTRTRLFHNNTVRTIAPEYGWVISPDGSELLISAERDGDTVSPERGIYLVHLNKKVTRARLLARLEQNLAAETALSEQARKMFAPITQETRRIVEHVSTGRIFEYERSLFDFDSKHIGQPGNRKAAEYLYRTYKSFGYEPEYQWFEPRGALGGKTANVIAILRGSENPELVYIVGSHFDSVMAGPGADDDTTGTAALLEAARVMAAKPLPATIIFASFTGEEAGLLGSREFVRRARVDKTNIVGVLNNDMIGWSNDNRLDNTIRYTNAGIRDIQHSAAMLFSKLITHDARYHKSTDATAFFNAFGDIVGGIGSYPVIGNPHYHTATDLLETINHQLVSETCKTTVATLMLLASSPSPVKNLRLLSFEAGTAELAWSPSLEKGIRSYVVTFGAPGDSNQQTRVNTPRVILKGIKPGTEVRVKAINARGLEGWDWSRITIGTPGRVSGD